MRVPDKHALIAPDGTSITFGDLWDQVCRLSHGLQQAGLQPGNRVIIMIPMSIPLYTTLLAVVKTGAAAVFVDPWMEMKRIAQFAAFAAPFGFVGIGKSHILRFLQPALRNLPLTITTGPRLLHLPARYTLAEMLTCQPSSETWQPDGCDAPALITFTSGSSGTPKGANRTHAFLAAQYQALCREYSYSDDDVDMPMFPVFALRNLASGITSVIPDMDFRKVATVDATRIKRQMLRHGVTTCTASPPFIERLAALAEPPQVLRRILTGGAPVSDEKLQGWRKAFPQAAISVVYGSTEAEPVASITLEDRLQLQGPGCCAGTMIPDIQARIIKISREPLAFTSWADLAPDAGGIGELIVSGDHVCRDYYKNPEAVKANKIVDNDGRLWHRMGDTGWIDAENRFWIAGRVHSTIFCKGTPLHPQLLEARIAALVPTASRIAVLETENQLFIVLHGEPVSGLLTRLQQAGIPADRAYWTQDPLQLDPRHQSKTDYDKLREWLKTNPSRFGQGDD